MICFTHKFCVLKDGFEVALTGLPQSDMFDARYLGAQLYSGAQQ